MSYVSVYEGFGFPPLEAMACGTTVIYGNNSSMPEVIGGAGLAAAANDVDRIKKQLLLLWKNTEKRNELQEAALKRAHQFSWTKTAWQTLSLYAQIIKSESPET